MNLIQKWIYLNQSNNTRWDKKLLRLNVDIFLIKKYKIYVNMRAQLS